jgi:hypothetical protein
MISRNAIFVRIGRSLRALFRDKGPQKPPPDPRALANPWLGKLLDQLGERYRLGADTPQGIQILRRTGKARFNPMRAWLRTASCIVSCEYEAHVPEGEDAEAGRRLLDRSITSKLKELGLSQTSEKVEAWHGHLVTRGYEGPLADIGAAVAAVRYICELSEQVMDTATV